MVLDIQPIDPDKIMLFDMEMGYGVATIDPAIIESHPYGEGNNRDDLYACEKGCGHYEYKDTPPLLCKKCGWTMRHVKQFAAIRCKQSEVIEAKRTDVLMEVVEREPKSDVWRFTNPWTGEYYRMFQPDEARRVPSPVPRQRSLLKFNLDRVKAAGVKPYHSLATLERLQENDHEWDRLEMELDTHLRAYVTLGVLGDFGTIAGIYAGSNSGDVLHEIDGASYAEQYAPTNKRNDFVGTEGATINPNHDFPVFFAYSLSRGSRISNWHVDCSVKPGAYGVYAYYNWLITKIKGWGGTTGGIYLKDGATAQNCQWSSGAGWGIKTNDGECGAAHCSVGKMGGSGLDIFQGSRASYLLSGYNTGNDYTGDTNYTYAVVTEDGSAPTGLGGGVSGFDPDHWVDKDGNDLDIAEAYKTSNVGYLVGLPFVAEDIHSRIRSESTYFVQAGCHDANAINPAPPDYPVESDVRINVDYDYGNLTGTMDPGIQPITSESRVGRTKIKSGVL